MRNKRARAIRKWAVKMVMRQVGPRELTDREAKIARQLYREAKKRGIHGGNVVGPTY